MATGLIFSLFDVASAQEVPFGIHTITKKTKTEIYIFLGIDKRY